MDINRGVGASEGSDGESMGVRMGEGKNKGKIVRGREMRRGEAVGREKGTRRKIEEYYE